MGSSRRHSPNNLLTQRSRMQMPARTRSTLWARGHRGVICCRIGRAFLRMICTPAAREAARGMLVAGLHRAARGSRLEPGDSAGAVLELRVAAADLATQGEMTTQLSGGQ